MANIVDKMNMVLTQRSDYHKITKSGNESVGCATELFRVKGNFGSGEEVIVGTCGYEYTDSGTVYKIVCDSCNPS